MKMLASGRSFFQGRLPGQAVIQITTHCNARCAQCGMSANHSFMRHNLDTEIVEKILDTVARLHMQAVSFTGGEPLLDFDRLLLMIRKARKLGIPYIRTGTNGFVFRHSERADFEDRMRRMADQLLESGLRNFWISLDSCIPEIHETNRGLPGVVRGMAKALPIFHQRGLYPSVNLGINRLCGGHIPVLTQPFEAQRFEDGFAEALGNFFAFAVELGFSMANCCYPMSGEDDAVYQATSENTLVAFQVEEKLAMLRALRRVVTQFRPKIRLFTPLSSLDALLEQGQGNATSTYACRGGQDFFFVDASRGHAYPCGYRNSDDMGPFWELALPQQSDQCRRCDWECFRDPSELFGPFGMALRRPGEMLRKFSARPGAWSTWLTDLRYYLACDLFDGTKPMRPHKLARFAPTAQSMHIAPDGPLTDIAAMQNSCN